MMEANGYKNMLQTAIKSRDIDQLTKAIDDFKNANVVGEGLLLEKAERRLKKLIKLDKKRRKMERKTKREARRQVKIDALNDLLQRAMDAEDIDQLQDALQQCENSGYDDKEIFLVEKAEELLDKLIVARLHQNMSDAIDRRDIYTLENTIDQAEYGGYIVELGETYQCAKDLLFHLQELHRLREAISGMNRSMISEIQRYPTPPKLVHTVMTAALVMLGEPISNVADWTNVQVLLGKLGDQSITRRVRRSAPGDITPALRTQVENLLQTLNIDAVAEISQGAAAFFAWMQCMLKESYYAQSPRADEN